MYSKGKKRTEVISIAKKKGTEVMSIANEYLKDDGSVRIRLDRNDIQPGNA